MAGGAWITDIVDSEYRCNRVATPESAALAVVTVLRQALLENVRPEIAAEVAYAFDLATLLEPTSTPETVGV